MKKALMKDTVKEITNTFKRFISLMLIVLLGVGFFAGIRVTSPDMRNTLDKTFDEYEAMDIQVLSTLGITKEDIKELQKIEGVEKVEASYVTDAIVNIAETEEVVKIMALSNEINKTKIVEGRLPENNKECVVEPKFLTGTEQKIGDKIKIEVEDVQDEDGKDQPLLKQKEVTIVGTVNSPLYISSDRGTTKLGSGKISYYMYIPLDNFDTKIRTVAYITVEGAKELKTYSAKYEDKIEEVKARIEDISEERRQARYQEVYNQANKKIQDAQKELNTQKAKAEKELKDAKQKIENAKQQIRNGKTELESKKTETNTKLAQGKTELDKAEKELQEKEKLFETEKEKILATLEFVSPEQKEQMIKQLEEQEKLLKQARNTLNTQKQQYEASKKTAEQELTKAQRELTTAENEIQTNETKLQTEQKKADKEIQNAQEKLEDAKIKLADIQKPEWYILDRNQNIGYVSYLQDADRIDNIAKVFPVVFFVVAALISLTSMTRMVEEQRVQIGTLKGLGYSKRQIANKYLLYATLAAVLGSILGVSIGFYFIPKIICNMYGMMYNIGDPVLEFDVGLTAAGLLAASVCTVGATVYSCIKALATTPATLMRPKAPKSGKRVLLEKIPFIWKHLNFTQKVTIRNIFRYKKRFLMTIIGVAGCTALIVAGFGLRDAIGSMIPTQYGEVFKHQVEITLKDNLKQEESKKAYERIIKNKEIQNTIRLNQQSVEIVKSNNNQSIQLIVPEKVEDLQEFIVLRNRKQKEQTYILDEQGVIITEKLAKLLEIREDDEIIIRNIDKVEVKAKVVGITENYLLHYIYMSPKLYEQLYREEVKVNTVFANTEELTEEQENVLGKAILADKDNISSVQFNSVTTTIFSEVMDNMALVVWVLIIAAGLLALVVLYNLSNTNISERMRELATIKVLGFYNLEVYEYVGKETLLLTLIGILVGLLGGNFLTTFIIKTCELDAFMFNPQIKLASYVYGIVITLLFATIVNILTYFALKKIDMIESLKSVE
ncbi:MAG: ABC transporter permease [Clostridia bacterium]|nr:ABC transporter permease [Clostridia bacterium]MCI9413512.1 ABC transporter permease [Clostridia bacterium]